MALLPAIFLIVAAFVTAAISGVFGMAGGLMLNGALALVLPVSATFVAHGILQLVANGWRAILHRKFLDWRIVAVFAVGSILAGGVMAFIAVEPSKATLYLLMGLVPGLLWIPQRWVSLDAAKPAQALACGVSVTGLNLTAGVDDAFRITEELLKQKRTFSALMAYDDMTAFGALRALAKAGIKVPQECSLIGFDDINPSQLFVPSLTTVRQPMEAMGASAVSILIEGISAAAENRSGSAIHRKLPAELVIRESTQAVP